MNCTLHNYFSCFTIWDEWVRYDHTKNTKMIVAFVDFKSAMAKANNKEGSKDNQALSEIDITLSFINMCLIPVLRHT
jgi:hypothetical protein